MGLAKQGKNDETKLILGEDEFAFVRRKIILKIEGSGMPFALQHKFWVSLPPIICKKWVPLPFYTCEI